MFIEIHDHDTIYRHSSFELLLPKIRERYIYICIYISHLPYNLIVHVNKLLTNRIMIFCTDIFSVQRRALIVEGCLLGTIRSFRFLSEVQYFNEKQDAFTQEVSQQGS